MNALKTRFPNFEISRKPRWLIFLCYFRYKVGSIINVKVKLIANDLGHFRFNLCPLEGPNDLETEMCFNQYPLQLYNSYPDDKFYLPNYEKDFYISIQLPPNVICEHCVLRWTYEIGNHVSRCYNGEVSFGCGSQKTFRNCADIAITLSWLLLLVDNMCTFVT